MPNPIWTPSAETVARANMTAFREMVAEQIAPSVTDYASLYRWSIDNPALFWPAVWEFCGVNGRRAARTIDYGNRMPGATWFPEAHLNFAENLMRRRDAAEAIVFWNEQGRQSAHGFDEVYEQAAALAAAMRGWGVTAGDRVAGYLPNLPETLIAMLAATSIGAIWTSCSPDFGLTGVLDRFGQTAPRILIAASSYRYNGRRYSYLERVRGLVERIDSIEHTVVVPYLEAPPAEEMPANSVLWGDALSQGAGAEARFEPLPFDHPVYILYSSGTTGKPKCILHGAGGTLLQHLKELTLHTNLKPGDRIVYFTTCGWMMWNWLASSLAVGATIVLYDGSPMYPTPDALWELAERERVNIFGTSAKYLSALDQAGVAPIENRQLEPLRAILSTGSPLAPEGFDFVYNRIKRDVCLSSISGGTDIVSCFALGNPVAPVYRGEIQTRGLGMAVEIFDETGRSLASEPGELVCTRPFPSMPVSFWDDTDGEKYRQAYFDRFSNIWHHGDWAKLTESGGVVIYGRSDAVLNPGGVRIGTAEIYRIVEQLPEIAESIVVGQEWENDVRVVLFVKLKPGEELTGELRLAIRARIRTSASPRHVPAKIIAVADIPRTINNKITELAVRDVIHNRPVRNTEGLLNPEALELFRNHEELRTP
jgi:acetoacetyl-CoA synthetase